MLWPLAFLACAVFARLAATRLCLDDRYPAWRARRRAEGRWSSYLAFAMLHANPLFDGQGYLDWFHPANRREHWLFALIGAVAFILSLLACGTLIALVNGFGTK